MTSSLPGWRVTPNANDDEAYAILAQDLIWNSFALADLEPPLRFYSQFATAQRYGGDERAICLIFRHPIIGDVISPFGAEDGLAAILAHVDLPDNPQIQAQERHLPALQHYYQPETQWRKMFRMAATPEAPPARQSTPHPVKRMEIADLPALSNLYQQDPEIPFSASLFSDGLYFGAYDGERIIAAGGTHALVPARRIAVLGHILTALDARRQGYATAITSALMTTLFELGFSPVILNVFEDNTSAFRIYQRLGFQTHCTLVSGKAIRMAN